MHVMILGGGGREHALAWKIAQSPMLSRLTMAPGNAGMSDLGDCIELEVLDGATVTAWATANAVDLVVVGPEAPLAAGVADALRAAGVPVFGPNRDAAQLEASKAFTKMVCDAADVPTAAWARFTDETAAISYVRSKGAPIVIKADGVAAGKGVVVAETLDQAEAALVDMFGGSLGAAGAEVVIEEFMHGEEASFFVLTDGEAVVPLATAQDHKRAFDGDQGPNTGGMGAYSPAPVMTEQVIERTLDQIVRPTIAEMARRGTPYSGVLYVGLMIDAGRPRLIEYNARFGDPETQALVLRLESDLLPVLLATAMGQLKDTTLDWMPYPAITVVLATKGYPGSYPKGTSIGGLSAASALPGVTIFHAGTKEGPGGIEAHGGRVLNVSATGATVREARDLAYAAIDKIGWPEGFCRTDIAWRVLGN